MSVKQSAAAGPASWGELFQGENAAYTLMVMMGVMMYSLQILIVVTMMPTVVRDLGGSSYYVWASMLYQIGAIVGSASVGPVWARTGGRGAFLAAGAVFAAGTLVCAMSADMLVLIIGRSVQGYGGGLIIGGTMGFVSRVYAPNVRTRILAVYQGFWSVCALIGPFVGGVFAEIGWWRGAFWAFLPLIAIFCGVAWLKVPKTLTQAGGGSRFPFLRIALLALGVLGVAESGQIALLAGRVALLVVSVGSIAMAFVVDARAKDRMFPSRPLSLSNPVGMGYWILIIVGVAQSSVTILLPLVLQVVYEVTPLLVGMTNMINSTSWTIGTFIVAGWTGSRERLAMRSGPVFMLLAVVGFLCAIYGSSLALILIACFFLGFGVGVHHVHLSSRTMEGALKGEETVTASSMSMIRSLGQAMGTAIAGMVANMAGLGGGVDAATVSNAVTAVFAWAILPVSFALWLIVRLSALPAKTGKVEEV